MNPTISVIMAVYNEQDGLALAIDSILQQSYQDFEFIIIDDCSNDKSPAILNTYAQNNANIKVVRNQTNLGLAESLNIGIRLARGEWIARMDGDDISLPQRFEKQIAYLQSHPLIDVLSTAIIDITPTNEPLGKRNIPEYHNQLAWRTIWASPAFHGTVMMRKNKFLQSDGYKQGETLEDVELWSRMIQYSRFAALPDYLYQYRRTSSEYNTVLEERTTATLEICRNFVSQVSGSPVSMEDYQILRLSTSILQPGTLSEEQIYNAVGLLHNIYNAMINKGILDVSADLKDVQADLFRRTTNLMMQSEIFIIQYGAACFRYIPYDELVKAYWKRSHLGIFRWLFFAFLNPGVALRIIKSRLSQ